MLTQEEKEHLIIVLTKELQQNKLNQDYLSLKTNYEIINKLKKHY